MKFARTARELLNELLSQARDLATASSAGQASLTTLAERALAVAPGAESWQTVSRDLVQLRDAAARRESRAELDARLTAIVARLRSEARKDSPAESAADARNPALRGAWTDEVRRR